LAARNKWVCTLVVVLKHEPGVGFSGRFRRFQRPKSNFRMAESKFGMLPMRVHNKIIPSLGGGDAILGIKTRMMNVLLAQN